MSELDPTAPVTRAEFGEFRTQVAKDIGDLARHIDELLKSKQVSWPLIFSVIALVGAAVGFGIKNLSDVASLAGTAANTAVSMDGFRERVRALEAAHVALSSENETQHRWMADVINLENEHTDRLVRSHHPDIPERRYYPLGRIGATETVPLNGRK